jgi:flavorubredoxin
MPILVERVMRLPRYEVLTYLVVSHLEEDKLTCPKRIQEFQRDGGDHCAEKTVKYLYTFCQRRQGIHTSST